MPEIIDEKKMEEMSINQTVKLGKTDITITKVPGGFIYWNRTTYTLEYEHGPVPGNKTGSVSIALAAVFVPKP